MPVAVEHQVARLDVSMNNAALVCKGQRPSRADHQVEQLAWPHRTFLINVFLQGAAVHQLKGEKHLPLVFRDFKDGNNAGMLEFRDGAGFLHEKFCAKRTDSTGAAL